MPAAVGMLTLAGLAAHSSVTVTFDLYIIESWDGNGPNGNGSNGGGHLGYGTGDFGDSTYRLSYTFTSSASTLAIGFTSLQNQGPGDEGWGLDNVSVSIAPVPEPTSAVLLGLGLAGLVLRGRKRV